MTVTAVIPIRSFRGIDRLAGFLPADSRMRLMGFLAERTCSAVERAGIPPLVVTNDPEVRSWAERHGRAVVGEPRDGGLDGAAAAGLADCDGPWIVVHADLPLILPGDVSAAAARATSGWVIAPSRDGGTSLVGGPGGGFRFSYGPGSFRRHLARLRGDAHVLVRRGLAVDLDRPRDLIGLGELGALPPEFVDPTHR